MTKKIIYYIFIITISVDLHAQKNGVNNNQQPVPSLIEKSVNRNKPGSYKQILNADITTISPGDRIKVSHFISGYGYIDYKTAKIFYSSSANIIDESSSTVTHGFLGDEQTNKTIWGGLSHELNSDVNSILILKSSIINEDTEKTANMFSKPENVNSPIIFFELILNNQTKKSNPPILWSIKTKDDLLPGEYYLTYVFTYFNGEKWQNDKVELKIKVMTWYERKESTIQTWSYIILIITILGFIFSIPSYVSSCKDFFQKKTSSHKKDRITLNQKEELKKVNIKNNNSSNEKTKK